jgi:hypothetical protein
MSNTSRHHAKATHGAVMLATGLIAWGMIVSRLMGS